MAKKERSRLKFAEHAVHLIPLVLLLCAFILWLFSTPVEEVGMKGSIAERIEGLTIEGEVDSDGTQSAGTLPAGFELGGDVDLPNYPLNNNNTNDDGRVSTASSQEAF